MGGIEARSCDGISPQKQWGIWSKWRSFLPAEVQVTTCLNPYEDSIIKFKGQKKAKHIFKWREEQGCRIKQLYMRKAKNTKIHINQCKWGISLKHKKITLIENVVIYYQYNYLWRFLLTCSSTVVVSYFKNTPHWYFTQ